MTSPAQRAEIAAQIIRDARADYCRDVLGWNRERVDALVREPAAWIQEAVEIALLKGREI